MFKKSISPKKLQHVLDLLPKSVLNVLEIEVQISSFFSKKILPDNGQRIN